jgi:hypothetical protein
MILVGRIGSTAGQDTPSTAAMFPLGCFGLGKYRFPPFWQSGKTEFLKSGKTEIKKSGSTLDSRWLRRIDGNG